MADVIDTFAGELYEAAVGRVPIAPLTARAEGLTIADAYAIQTRVIDRRIAAGARPVGRKIGLTSKPMQDLLGVDEPDFGVLLDDMVVEDGDEILVGRFRLYFISVNAPAEARDAPRERSESPVG